MNILKNCLAYFLYLNLFLWIYMPIIIQSFLFVYAHCEVLTYYVKRFRVILWYLALYKCYNDNNNNFLVRVIKLPLHFFETKVKAVQFNNLIFFGFDRVQVCSFCSNVGTVKQRANNSVLLWRKCLNIFVFFYGGQSERRSRTTANFAANTGRTAF